MSEPREDGQRDFWNSYWQDQSVTMTARTMTQILDRIKVQYLRDILPPYGNTLEVGCGSGRLSCMLATKGYQTICMDYSQTAMGAAKANYRQADVTGRFIVGEGHRLPLATNSLDIVLSTGLLEHFPDPTHIVGEMVRVLKPGGLFYSDIVPRKFSLFRSLDWIGRLKRGWARSGVSEEGFYERAFTNNEIVGMLRNNGLEKIHVFPAGVIPPYLPFVSRVPRLREWQVTLANQMQSVWQSLDATILAEWLGFYYFAYGKKPVT